MVLLSEDPPILQQTTMEWDDDYWKNHPAAAAEDGDDDHDDDDDDDGGDDDDDSEDGEDEEKLAVNNRSGGSKEGKAFLVHRNELPPKDDPRMKYYNDQMEIGKMYYGTEALNATTFKEFKEKVSFILNSCFSMFDFEVLVD
jgi:cobalamin biosynthesis protein CobT